jgi:hypothetical protein
MQQVCPSCLRLVFLCLLLNDKKNVYLSNNENGVAKGFGVLVTRRHSKQAIKKLLLLFVL